MTVVELVEQNGAVFGPYLITVLLMAAAISWLAIKLNKAEKKNDVLVADNQKMSLKAIEVMTLATTAMKDAKYSDAALVKEVGELKLALVKNSCKYGG